MWPFVFLPLGPQQFKDLHIWCEPSDVSWVASLNLHEHVWAAHLPPCPLLGIWLVLDNVFWGMDLDSSATFLVRSPWSRCFMLTRFHWAIKLFNILKENFTKRVVILILNAAFRCEWMWHLPCILRKVSRPRQSPELVWKYHRFQFICTKMPCGPRPAPEVELNIPAAAVRAALCLLRDLTPQHIELCNSMSHSVHSVLHHRSGCGVNAALQLCSIGTLKADLLTIKSDTKVCPMV